MTAPDSLPLHALAEDNLAAASPDLPWAARGDAGTPLEQLIEQTGPFSVRAVPAHRVPDPHAPVPTRWSTSKVRPNSVSNPARKLPGGRTEGHRGRLSAGPFGTPRPQHVPRIMK